MIHVRGTHLCLVCFFRKSFVKIVFLHLIFLTTIFLIIYDGVVQWLLLKPKRGSNSNLRDENMTLV